MNETVSLQPGRYYHIYNRGNNHENLFRDEGNYRYFLEQYAKYTCAIADTYAYCLLKNHFHLLVRIKAEEEWQRGLVQSRQTSGVLVRTEVSTLNANKTPEVSFVAMRSFGNFFNAYAKAINKRFQRTGRLFEESFKRIEVDSDTYIHQPYFLHPLQPTKAWLCEGFSGVGVEQLRGDALEWRNQIETNGSLGLV